MRINQFALSLLIPAVVALVGLPGQALAQAKKAESKAAAPMTGKDAYWEVYKLARQWSPDIQVLSLKSETVPGSAAGDGKAAAWTVAVASPTMKQMRTITWSLVPFGAFKKGMNSGAPVAWAGPTTKSKPFSMTDVTLDSSDAEKKATDDPKGATWLKAHPGLPVEYYLGSEQKYPAPVWVVTHGNKAERYTKALLSSTGAAVQ